MDTLSFNGDIVVVMLVCNNNASYEFLIIRLHVYIMYPHCHMFSVGFWIYSL